MTQGGNNHDERQSLLSRISGGVIRAAGGARRTVTTTSAAAAPAASVASASSSEGYGTRSATASSGGDEESARPQHQRRMPYGYHMSMTNGSSLTERTAIVGSYDDGDDDDDSSDNDSQDSHEEDESHEIGYLGSYAIAINSLAGPAVLQLPFQYQQSGFVATTLALLGVAIVSVACSMYICRVVQAIPATAKLERPVELSTVVDYFWSRKAYLITQWLFFACTFCLNVAAMIDTAQVVDTFLGVSGGKMLRTIGWTPFPINLDGAGDNDEESSRYFHTWIHPRCTRKQVKLGHCDPFVYNVSHEVTDGTNATLMEPLSGPILTLGYVITAAVFAPLCVMDLKENTNWQIGGCFLLLTLSAYFCFAFLQMDLDDGGSSTATATTTSSASFLVATQKHHNNLPLWGQEYRDLLGVILFNFALVLALPAWLHTKKRNVKNMLAPMVSGAFGTGIQAASSLFCFFIIGLDIPLFCVLTRYNLSKLLPGRPTLVNALVVYIPWGLSWILYQGDAIGTLLDWGGVLLTSAIAFLLPLYLAYRVLLYTDLPLFPDLMLSASPSARRAQIRTVLTWLIVTAVAVFAAIAGQAAVQADKYEYLHSDEYLNGTAAA